MRLVSAEQVHCQMVGPEGVAEVGGATVHESHAHQVVLV